MCLGKYLAAYGICSLALVLLAQSSIKVDVEFSPKESQDLIAEQIV